MPLSEHEQRLLEQIERSLLDEDPKFASTVRATDPRRHVVRRVIWAALLFVVGIGLLIVGLISQIAPAGVPVLSILGFVLMLGAMFLAVQSYRKSDRPELRVVGGSERSIRVRRGSSTGGSLLDRLEQRWQRRRGGDLL